VTAPFGRILIVDDEKPVLDVLAEYFGSQGHEIETAQNGVEAITAFTRQRPDLVLLDVRMPGMDGVETLRRLRAMTAAVPIVMVTANEDVALARLTLKLGAFDYVSKPFDFVLLDRTVTAAVSQAGERGERAPSVGKKDARRSLASAVFRATRAMPSAARASTGARLEDAAIAIALDARTAASRLDEIALLIDLAAELGDLADADHTTLAAAVTVARQALSSG